MDNSWIDICGMIGGVILPLFSLPLILRVLKRKSSSDISLVWAIGVYSCFIVMLPSAVTSEDLIYKTYSIINIILFTGVVFVAVKYRKGPSA